MKVTIKYIAPILLGLVIGWFLHTALNTDLTDIPAEPEEQSMSFKQLTPNLIVADVVKSVEWYGDVFGFELVMSVPEEGALDWAMVKLGGVTLMFQSIESIPTDFEAFKGMQPGGTLILYVDVDDATALYESVKDNTEIIVDLHKTFYGADEFAVKDLDGYVIAFATQDQ